MSPNSSSSRDGGAPQQHATLQELRDMSLYLVEVKNVLKELVQLNKEGLQGILNEVMFMKASVKTELAEIKKAVEELSSAVTTHPSFSAAVSSRNITSAHEDAESLAIGCLEYCRLSVGLSILGKGDPFDCFANPNEVDDLGDNCAKFVLGDSVGLDDIERLLDLYTTSGRSELKVYREAEVSTEQIKKLKRLRERITLQRWRVHDMVVPKVVDVWMREAPGFGAYRYGVCEKEQPESVVNAAKEALRQAQGEENPKYMDGSVFGESFREACKELMRASSYVVAQAFMEFVRVVPRELTDQLKRNVRMVDTEQGYPDREIHAFSEMDGFLPEQLAFVIVQVGSRLSDIVFHGQARAKRGLEFGRYQQWLKRTKDIITLVTENTSKETLARDDWTYVRPCDPINVYGVPIRGNLPPCDMRMIAYLETIPALYDLCSEVAGIEGESQGHPPAW